MFTRSLAVLACIAAFCPGHLEAGVAEPQQIVESSFATLKATGPEDFVRKLLEGGPMEGNKDALAQSSMLRSVETYYGKLESFEVVETVKMTAKTTVLYTVFNYESGPMFGMVTAFQGKNGWHTINFNFHTESARVWPSSLLFGCGGSADASVERTAGLRAPAAESTIR